MGVVAPGEKKNLKEKIPLGISSFQLRNNSKMSRK